MKWNYAELSKMAKAAGGPEALVEILVQAGKNKMIPWVIFAGVTGIGLGIAVTKLIEYWLDASSNEDLTVEQAKRELIDGIKKYDEEHDEKASVPNASTN